MFSKKVPDAPENIQWPLNQAAYQNVTNDQVDWAALAQQWIQRKEIFPTQNQTIEAPPPPTISRSDLEEQGEAPMEVERDEETTLDWPGTTTMSSGGSGWYQNQTYRNSFNQPQQQSQPTAIAPATNPYLPTPHHPSVTTAIPPAWSNWVAPNNSAATTTHPNHLSMHSMTSESGVVRPQPPLLQSSFAMPMGMGGDVGAVAGNNLPGMGGYWGPMKRNPTQSMLHQQRAPHPALIHTPPTEVMMDDKSCEYEFESSLPVLDAAKRKNLPAWIRDGLEKMERDKQRQAERERELKDREILLEQQRLAEADALKALKLDGVQASIRSKFDSDSDSDSPPIKAVPEVVKVPIRKHKPKEEDLQDFMFKVRGVLTEILLEVTNEEILSIAKETLSKTRSKARTAQTVKKTGLSAVAGGLGLGIYADSSDESESDKSEPESENEDDSEAELLETIKRKESAFEEFCKENEVEPELIEEETDSQPPTTSDKEEEVSAAASAETISDTKHKMMSNIVKESGEIHLGKVSHIHGQFEKKASRFSDAKDTVKIIHLMPANINTSHLLSGQMLINTATSAAPVASAQTTTTTTSSSSSSGGGGSSAKVANSNHKNDTTSKSTSGGGGDSGKINQSSRNHKSSSKKSSSHHRRAASSNSSSDSVSSESRSSIKSSRKNKYRKQSSRDHDERHGRSKGGQSRRRRDRSRSRSSASSQSDNTYSSSYSKRSSRRQSKDRKTSTSSKGGARNNDDYRRSESHEGGVKATSNRDKRYGKRSRSRSRSKDSRSHRY